MGTLERRAALLARLDTLERHALALEGAFVDGVLKAEASHLLATLRATRTTLDGATDAASLQQVERTLDAASRKLGSIGSST